MASIFIPDSRQSIAPSKPKTQAPSYDRETRTYTDKYGNKYSMREENVPKKTIFEEIDEKQRSGGGSSRKSVVSAPISQPQPTQKNLTEEEKQIVQEKFLESTKPSPSQTKEVQRANGSGAIKAATPTESKAMQRAQNPIWQFWYGLSGQGDVTKDYQRRYMAATPAERIGMGAQIIGGAKVAPEIGEIGIGGARAASSAWQRTGSAKWIAEHFRADLAFKAGGSAASSTASAKIGESLSISRAESQLPRGISKKEYRDIINQATKEESEAINRDKWYRKFLYSITQGLSTQKNVYTESVERQGKAKGLSDAEINRLIGASQKTRGIRTGSEIATQFAVNVQSEAIGQALVKKRFGQLASRGAKPKTFSEIFKATATPIGIAGLYEGGQVYSTGQISKGQKVGVMDYLTFSLFGGASAAIIGGSIAGTAITAPKTSKKIQLAANLADPYEYPADVAEAAIYRTKAAIRKQIPKYPTIAMTPTDPNSIIFGVTPVTTQTKTDTKTRTNTRPNIKQPVPTFSNIPINPNVPIPPPDIPDIIVPEPTQIQEPVNVKIDIPVPVTTNINELITTNIFATTQVPVMTPFMRLPPIYPSALAPEVSSGGRGSRAGKRKVFLNEITISNLLFGIRETKRGKKSKSRSKSAKTKQARPPTDIFSKKGIFEAPRQEAKTSLNFAAFMFGVKKKR